MGEAVFAIGFFGLILVGIGIACLLGVPFGGGENKCELNPKRG